MTGFQANHFQRRKHGGCQGSTEMSTQSSGSQGSSQVTRISELFGGDDAEPSRPLGRDPVLRRTGVLVDRSGRK